MARGRFSNPRSKSSNDMQPLDTELELDDISLDLPDLDLDFDMPAEPENIIDVSAETLTVIEALPDSETAAEAPAEPEPVEEISALQETPVDAQVEDTISEQTEAGEKQELPEPSEEKPAAPKAKLSTKKKILIGIAAALLVIVVGFGAFIGISLATDPYDNRILNNVTIAGVNVGGMTREEAEAAVHLATDGTYTRQDMVVSLPHGTITLTPADTGAQLNVRSAVRAAYIYGRWGSKEEKQAIYDASQETEHAIDASSYLGLKESFIQEQLASYASQHETAKTEYSYRMEGSMPALEEENYSESNACQTLMVTLGTPSLGLDMDEIYNLILDAYRGNEFQVTVEDIDDAAKPEPVDLDALYTEFSVAPVDASLDMEKYVPIPGDYGYSFDMEAARKIVDEAEYGETVAIPMMYVEPEIKQDAVYFRDVLGECKTPHTDNENRNENLRVACASLNGLVLQPGEILSYNDTLGERTKERGYLPAPAYSGNELVDSYGGGICQVSSTLYYCTLLSDLEIVDRINHGFSVGYIDLGMDATVSWGRPDFKFKNNTNFPIKIEAWVEDGHVNMRILGTIEKDYYVKMEYEIVGGAQPGTTTVTYPASSGYYDGQVLYFGEVGHYVKTYRCKYDRETDELISRDFEARSHYQASNRVVVSISG